MTTARLPDTQLRPTHQGPDRLPAWGSGLRAVVDADHDTVHVHGRLDVFTVDLLRGAILNLHETSGTSSIRVDLARIEQADLHLTHTLTRLCAELADLGLGVSFTD